MSKLMARPSTIAAAISATEKKITSGYDKNWRYSDSYEQKQIETNLYAIRKEEVAILQKLKSLRK